MIHIVLMILKWIGIILGILLGIILLTIGLVLFVPVRYRIEAVRMEGEGNPPVEARAKITWLFHFIHVKILYPSDIYLKVRVLFFTVFRFPQEEKKSKKKNDGKRNKIKRKDRKKEKPGAGRDDNQSDNSKMQEKDLNDSIKKEERGTEDVHKSYENAVNTKKTSADKEVDDNQENPQKLSLKEKIIKIWKFFQNIWYTLKGICGRIKELLENIEYYLDVLKSDTFKQAYALCKDELGSLFAYIKPRKFDVDLIIGMDDPAVTGQILSYYGILYPIIGNHVTVTGDFDRRRIEGSVFIKGKIKIFTFIKAVVRIYFNKDIRELLKLFKKEDV